MSFPLIVPTSSSASGFARSQYRPALLADIGYFARGVVTTELTGLEPEHYVQSDTFRSDTAPATAFDDLYVYVTSGAQLGAQRAAAPGGFNGPRGVAAVDRPFDAVLQQLVTFEVSELPAEDYFGLTGANTIINLALRSLPLIDLVDFSATDRTTEYSLISYPWPIKGIGRLFAPRTDTTERRREVPGVMLVNDAELPILKLPYAFTAGDVFTLEVHRPADTWIRQSGAWGSSTTGLTSDTDEALYDVPTVVATARPLALKRLAQRFRRGSAERADILATADRARVQSAVARFYGAFRGDGRLRVGAI